MENDNRTIYVKPLKFILRANLYIYARQNDTQIKKLQKKYEITEN